jgi:mycothiol system anti-sigma-R factor
MAHDHDHPEAPSNCEEALAEVFTYLDGELTDAKREGIASHLEGCNPCYEVFDFEAELRVVISTKAHSDEVPESLRVRISEKLSHMRIERGADGGGGAHPAGA